MNIKDANAFINDMLSNTKTSKSMINTFKEEYEWLKAHLSYALPFKTDIPEDCYKKCPDIKDVINSYLHYLKRNHLMEGEHLSIVPFTDSELDNFKILDKINNQFISNQNNDPKQSIYPNDLTAQINRYGGEFLGMYVSMHSHFEDKDYPWGIYLFPEVIKKVADELQKKAALPRKDQSLYRKLLLFSVFRHELFHFQVERFTTILEIAQKRSLYLPYKKTVYCHYYLSKYCLEEALAEHTAIESRTIRNKLKSEFTPSEIRSILEAHARSLPPGYRDFACPEFGGPDKAHQILAAQIAYTTPHMDVHLTDLTTVKSQFMTNNSDVPIYIVAPQGGLTPAQKIDAINIIIN
jgi:hypothetical protein